MNKLVVSILLFGLTGCAIVGPQERGVRVAAGKAGAVLDPGPHFWLPILYGIADIDVSVQNSEIKTTSASRDMQEIHTTVAVNWSVIPDEVSNVYKTLGDEDDALDRVVTPAVNEVLKASTAQLTAEEILTKRMELKKHIDEGLENRLKKFGLVLSSVNIVDLQFSDEFTKAIESKQISEQQAKQANYVAEKAKKDAEAAVHTARGEAESNRLKQQTLSEQLIRYEAVQKWNGQLPTMMGGNGVVPFINVSPNRGN